MKHCLKVIGFFSVTLLAMALISCSNPSSGSSSGSHSYANNFKGTKWEGLDTTLVITGLEEIYEFTGDKSVKHYWGGAFDDYVNQYFIVGDNKCEIYNQNADLVDTLTIDNTDPTKAYSKSRQTYFTKIE